MSEIAWHAATSARRDGSHWLIWRADWDHPEVGVWAFNAWRTPGGWPRGLIDSDPDALVAEIGNKPHGEVRRLPQ